MRHHPGAAQIIVVLLACITVIALPGSGRRGDAAPLRPDVVIVGDSLTGGNVSYIAPTLRAAGIDAQVEGLSARRIAVSFNFHGLRDSGIARIRSVMASGVEPKMWVIQLGTNDLGVVQNCACPDSRVFAGELIDQLLAEIGEDAPTAWVTLVDSSRPDIANAFNVALDDRSIRHSNMTTIRWHELARHHPEWFQDAVHPNFVGVTKFTDMYVREIRRLLDNFPRPADPNSTNDLQRAKRLGFDFGF
ncbi:MAG: hypothetical protein ACI83Y_002897 [Candidatus Azotimanducaceae bacterium]|jgi:lysophospholipase L1-like esterase